MPLCPGRMLEPASRKLGSVKSARGDHNNLWVHRLEKRWQIIERANDPAVAWSLNGPLIDQPSVPRGDSVKNLGRIVRQENVPVWQSLGKASSM